MTEITDIWRFDLRRGNSKNPRDGACLLDAVSWFEYGHLGDRPKCVCPVLAAAGRGINDTLPWDARQELKRFLPRLPGTVDEEAEPKRVEYLVQHLARDTVTIALEARGFQKEAKALRAATSMKDIFLTAGSIERGLPYGKLRSSVGWVRLAAGSTQGWPIFFKSIADYCAKAADLADDVARSLRSLRVIFGAKSRASIRSEIYRTMVNAFDGALALGRQGEPAPIENWQMAQDRFDFARAKGRLTAKPARQLTA